ncbi:hypothetical protein FDECE_3573 [Fusarium decemcellulare]|nr:hypothetical protein FDECE_3573 [Fusarium decemcellulare]
MGIVILAQAYSSISGFNHERLSIVAEQMATEQLDKFGLEIYFADEHGDESAAAETDLSQPTRQTSESIETPPKSEVAPEMISQEHKGAPNENARSRWRPGNFFGNSSTTSALAKMVRLTTLVGPTTEKGVRPPSPSQIAPGHEHQYHIPGVSSTAIWVLIRLLVKLKGTDGSLTREKFAGFLRGVQGETAASFDQDTFDLSAFWEAMIGSYSDASKPLPPKELSKPLTNCFINSSHNTYLVGDALASHSTANQYRTVLLRGCRCVEIDVRNGEVATFKNDSKLSEANPPRRVSTSSNNFLPKASKRLSHLFRVGKADYIPTVEDLDRELSPQSAQERRTTEPIVLHGWTLAAPCGFQQVCKAMKESAFVNSDLPIIVSLEVHADLEQQEMMVKIMEDEWEYLLLGQPIEGYQLGVYTQSMHFRGFVALGARTPAHIFSVNESRILQLDKASTQNLFKHNQRYFFHNGMMLNQAMFSDESVWALKPEGYQSSDRAIITQRDTVPNNVLNISIFIFGGEILELHGNEDGSKQFQDIARFAKVDLFVGEQSYEKKPSGTQFQEPQSGVLGYMVDFGSVAAVVPQLSMLLWVDFTSFNIP